MRGSAQRKLTYSSQSHCTSTLCSVGKKPANCPVDNLPVSKSHNLSFIDYSLSFPCSQNVPVSSAPYIHQIPPFPPVPDLLPYGLGYLHTRFESQKSSIRSDYGYFPACRPAHMHIQSCLYHNWQLSAALLPGKS